MSALRRGSESPETVFAKDRTTNPWQSLRTAPGMQTANASHPLMSKERQPFSLTMNRQIASKFSVHLILYE